MPLCLCCLQGPESEPTATGTRAERIPQCSLDSYSSIHTYTEIDDIARPHSIILQPDPTVKCHIYQELASHHSGKSPRSVGQCCVNDIIYISYIQEPQIYALSFRWHIIMILIAVYVFMYSVTIDTMELRSYVNTAYRKATAVRLHREYSYANSLFRVEWDQIATKLCSESWCSRDAERKVS